MRPAWNSKRKNKAGVISLEMPARLRPSIVQNREQMIDVGGQLAAPRAALKDGGTLTADFASNYNTLSDVPPAK